MTVPQISLLDLIGQKAASTATAAATTDRQHFQDVLKTTLDQNTAADAVKSSKADQSPVRESSKQTDTKRAAQTDSNTAVQANAEQQKDDKSKAAAARAAARRMAAQTSAVLAEQDASAAPTPIDMSAPPAPDTATPVVTTQDPSSENTAKPDKNPVNDAAANAADAANAAANAAQTAAIAGAVVLLAPPPANRPQATPEGAGVTEGSSPAAGGIGDLLAKTLDQPAAANSAAGAPVLKSPDPKSADQTSSGMATASLTTDVVLAPTARGDGQGSGQGSSQQQGQTQSQNGGDQKQVDQGNDNRGNSAQQSPSVAPAPTFAPILPQAPSTLGTLLSGAVTSRADTTPTPDSGMEPIGTPVGLGLSAGAGSLTTLRSSETPNASPSPYSPTQQPLPIEQVALAIGRMTNGARSFSMQLNPEHLGSVDVRMEVDAKGKTKVAITAERPETLALLKLDSHHLVKALQDSGVAADQSSLNFSLREQSSNASSDRRSGSGSGQTARGANQATPSDAQDTEIIPVRMSLSRHLYDIHA